MGNAYSQSPTNPQQQQTSSVSNNNDFPNNTNYQYNPNENTNSNFDMINNNNNYISNINTNNKNITSQDEMNSIKRARKKQTGIRLSANQVQSIQTSKLCQNVEVDDTMDEAMFLTSAQAAYGPNARVEINYNNNNNNRNSNTMASSNSKRKNISYQVTFDSKTDAFNAYCSNANMQQKIIQDLNIKGSNIAFDKPCKPQSIDGITLQLDSDSSHILCGACLVYNYKDKHIATIHYSNRVYNNGVIRHSGDTQIHGKSVHTIKLGLSDLDVNEVKQLFFTLCACGPNDLSSFKELVISLHENDNQDINLIQYSIEQAGKARSVVMCRIFRNNEKNSNSNNNDNEGSDHDGSWNGGSNNEWSIQALGTQEWHISNKVCMHYQYATQLIDAHLKLMNEKDKKKNNKQNNQ